MALPASPHTLGQQATDDNGRPMICTHAGSPGTWDTDWASVGGTVTPIEFTMSYTNTSSTSGSRNGGSIITPKPGTFRWEVIRFEANSAAFTSRVSRGLRVSSATNGGGTEFVNRYMSRNSVAAGQNYDLATQANDASTGLPPFTGICTFPVGTARLYLQNYSNTGSFNVGQRMEIKFTEIV